MAVSNPATEIADPPLPIEQVVWQDSERMSGVPCFRGSRVPVVTLFDYLEARDSTLAFLDNFLGVSNDQVIRALYYGKSRLLGSDRGR